MDVEAHRRFEFCGVLLSGGDILHCYTDMWDSGSNRRPLCAEKAFAAATFHREDVFEFNAVLIYIHQASTRIVILFL